MLRCARIPDSGSMCPMLRTLIFNGHKPRLMSIHRRRTSTSLACRRMPGRIRLNIFYSRMEGSSEYACFGTAHAVTSNTYRLYIAERGCRCTASKMHKRSLTPFMDELGVITGIILSFFRGSSWWPLERASNRNGRQGTQKGSLQPRKANQIRCRHVVRPDHR